MDLSRLNLPPLVRPNWASGTCIPLCAKGCPSRAPAGICGAWEPSRGFHGALEWCAPAIQAMASAIPGFLTCERCKGSGMVERDCSLCGDSTFDHECNDGPAPCPRCNGTGKPQGAEGT